jgi:NAD-dependent DNA ligase
MPNPKSITPEALYVISSFIWDDEEDVEGLQQPEIYQTLAAANAAAKKMMVRYAEKLNPYGDVEEYDFHHHVDGDGFYYGDMEGGPHGHVATRIKVSKVIVSGGSKVTTVPIKGKKAVKSEADTEEDEVKKEEEEDEDEKPAKPLKKKASAPPKTAINAKTHRKVIPVGKPNCLRGLKILFTGTFETMDRKTSVATAITYGADVITKLEDTDYIVIGTRAGPKKLQEINEKELETISEEEFFQILENGIPKEKRERSKQLTQLFNAYSRLLRKKILHESACF